MAVRAAVLAAVLLACAAAAARAAVRPCGEFQIECECVVLCDHGAQSGAACAGREFSAEACAVGSVAVSEWLVAALATQLRLAADVPLNYAALPGTHNSAISKAYGYGIGEEKLNAWLREVAPRDGVRIANQQVSVSDQLRFGVRFFELDTHYFADDLRIGHCGGVDIAWLNELVAFMGKLLHRQIDWDTELLGCFSDKSLPLSSVFGELHDFLQDPAAADEIVIIMFDDQEDMQRWGKIPELLAMITKFFGNQVFTPPMKRSLYPDRWPSMRELAAAGTRIIFSSCQDYGAQMDPLIFYKYGPLFANWTEFDPVDFVGYPTCALRDGAGVMHTDTGAIVRVNGDSLEYGPFWNGTSGGEILPETVFSYVECNVNWPCADQTRPAITENSVWTWLPSEPAHPYPFMDNTTARWQTAPSASVPRRYPCKGAVETSWALSTNSGPWLALPSTGVVCPTGFAASLPINGLQNRALSDVLKASGADSLWLPWKV